MKITEHPPHAPSLMESTRAIGYSVEAAISDIIDNSISAHAQNIHICYFPVHGQGPYIYILDDGDGMSEELLHEAMRYGSCDPEEERTKDDLGRYGLGLKTAAKIVSIQEGGAGLSNIRFIQDTATGLIPKAVFARSLADLSENSFLELSESVLVRLGMAWLIDTSVDSPAKVLDEGAVDPSVYSCLLHVTISNEPCLKH